ncbi:hypothetical protein T4B_2254, partial [Trichinella pseudospiralis]
LSNKLTFPPLRRPIIQSTKLEGEINVNSDAQVLMCARVGLKFTPVMEIRFNWTANYEQFTGVVSLRVMADF